MNHINPNGFVKLDNKIGMYAILGYSKNKDIQVNSTTLNIYRALLQHKHQDKNSPLHGKAWVSVERLAVELALGERTVRRHINILKNVGLISVVKLKGQKHVHNVYVFHKPLSIEEFKEKYPEEVAEFERKLHMLEENEAEM